MEKNKHQLIVEQEFSFYTIDWSNTIFPFEFFFRVQIKQILI